MTLIIFLTPETTPKLDRIISTKFILAPKLNLPQIKYESSTDSIYIMYLNSFYEFDSIEILKKFGFGSIELIKIIQMHQILHI
jgi:hypothetical protein